MKKYETNKPDEVRKTIELPGGLVKSLEKVAREKRMTIKAFLELIIINYAKKES